MAESQRAKELREAVEKAKAGNKNENSTFLSRYFGDYQIREPQKVAESKRAQELRSAVEASKIALPAGIVDTLPELSGDTVKPAQQEKVSIGQPRLGNYSEVRSAQLKAAVEAVKPENVGNTIISLYADADVRKKLNEISGPFSSTDTNARLNREQEDKNMTAQERAAYLTILKNKDIATAEEYRRSLNLDARAMPELQEAVQDIPYLGKLGVAGVSGVTDALGGIAAAGDALRGKTPVSNPFDAVSGAARESIDSKLGKIVFDLTKTNASQATAAVVGYGTGMSGLTNVLMSTSAAGNAYKQGLSEGMTREQATGYGVINGLSEYLTESLLGVFPGANGMTDLSDMAKDAIAKNVNNAVGRFAANVGINAFGEATEEYLQAVLDPLYRYMATGEDQNWSVDQLWSEEAIYAALLGGISGGMIGGVVDGISGRRAQGDYDYYGTALDSGYAVMQNAVERGATTSQVTEDIVQQVASYAAATNTPVVWVKSGVLPAGVNAMEVNGTIFLSEDAQNPYVSLLAHETAHSIEGTKGHAALVQEVDAVIKADSDGALDITKVAEQYQKNTRAAHNTEMSIEDAQNEVVAQYIETHLFQSPTAMQTVMSANGGILETMRANRQYKKAYRSADVAGQRALRMERDMAKGIRQRQRPDAQQIEDTIKRVQRGDASEGRASIAKGNNGQDIVVIDTDQGLFAGVDPSEYPRIAREYINRHFRGSQIPLSDYDLAKVTGTSSSKYAYSGQTMDATTMGAKMKASTELDNLLKTAEYLDSSEDRKSHNFAGYGFDYYRTRFIVDGRVFEGIIDVGVSENGAEFYGMTNIKNVTSEQFDEYSNLLLDNSAQPQIRDDIKRGTADNANAPTGLPVYKGALSSRGAPIDTNIAQNAPGVNTQYTPLVNKNSRAGESFESLMQQLQEKIDEYGGMKLPGREIEVPKAINDKTFVSRTASTFLNEPKIREREEAKSVVLRQLFAGDFNREKMSFEELLKKERENIQRIGYEGMVQTAQLRFERVGDPLSNEETMRYIALHEIALEAGDWDTVQDCYLLLGNSTTASSRNMGMIKYLLEGLDGAHAYKLASNAEKEGNQKRKKQAAGRGEVSQEKIDETVRRRDQAQKEVLDAQKAAIDQQKRLGDLRMELQSAAKEIEALRAESDQMDADTLKTLEKITKKQQEAAGILADFNAQKADYDRAKAQLEEQQRQLRNLKARLKRMPDRLQKVLSKIETIGQRMEPTVKKMQQAKADYDFARRTAKEVEKINRQLAKWGVEVKMSDAVKQELLSARDELEVQTALAHAYQEIADQMPPTTYEQFMNYRYLAMLANFKTLVRNEIGNIANHLISYVDNTVATLVQRMVSKSDQQFTVFNWRATAEGKKIVDLVHKTAKEAAESESHKYIEGVKSQVDQRRAKFSNTMVGRGLEKVSAGVDTAMSEGVVSAVTKGKHRSAGDKVMFERNFAESLGRYMAANHLTEVTQQAYDHAYKDAQYYVFHGQNAITEAISKLRNTKLRFAIDAIMPFVGTPSNILIQEFQRSPVGLMVNTVRLGKALVQQCQKTGTVTADVINDFARSVTGNLLLAIGVALAHFGLLSGPDGDSEKEWAKEELAGDQAFSIDIMGTKISLDWLEPSSIPLVVGATIYEAATAEDGSGGEILFAGLCAGYDEMFNMSMLSGVLDLAGKGSISEGLLTIPQNIITQPIPTAVGQIARAIDPVQRKVTSGESRAKDWLDENNLGILSDMVHSFMAKIPGLTQFLEPQRDVFGNEVGRVGDTENWMLNAFQQVLSPAAITRKGDTDTKTDEVTQILLGLYESTGQGKVIPSEIKAKDFKEKLSDEGLADKYTSKLYQETREDVGQAQLEALWEMIDKNLSVELTETYTTAAGKEKRRTYSKRFDDMTEEEKVKAIAKTANEAKEITLEDLLDNLSKGANAK